jgi:peroxiredoxin
VAESDCDEVTPEAQTATTVGQMAADFTLTSTRGKAIRLSDACAEQRILLLFYPRNLAGG